jgi:hypothetical protein
MTLAWRNAATALSRSTARRPAQHVHQAALADGDPEQIANAHCSRS